MPRTNAFTARAATVQAPRLARPLRLIGIFDGPEGAAALVRDASGPIERITAQTTPKQLVSIGPGWALVKEGDMLHRLTIG